MLQTGVEKYHQKNSALRVNGLANHQSIISTKTENKPRFCFYMILKQMAGYISLRPSLNLMKPVGFHCTDFFSELIELIRDFVSCGCSQNAHLLRISNWWSCDSGSYAFSQFLKNQLKETWHQITSKELPELAQWEKVKLSRYRSVKTALLVPVSSFCVCRSPTSRREESCSRCLVFSILNRSPEHSFAITNPSNPF